MKVAQMPQGRFIGWRITYNIIQHKHVSDGEHASHSTRLQHISLQCCIIMHTRHLCSLVVPESASYATQRYGISAVLNIYGLLAMHPAAVQRCALMERRAVGAYDSYS